MKKGSAETALNAGQNMFAKVIKLSTSKDGEDLKYEESDDESEDD